MYYNIPSIYVLKLKLVKKRFLIIVFGFRYNIMQDLQGLIFSKL